MNDIFQYEFNIYYPFLCQDQSSWIIDMEVSNDGKCKVDSQDQMSFSDVIIMRLR